AIELELDPFVKVDHVRICGAETADVGRLGIAEAHRPVTPGEERSVFRAEVFLERAVHGEPIERQPFLLHIALVGEATLAVTTEMPCFERAIQTLEYGTLERGDSLVLHAAARAQRGQLGLHTG